MKQVFIQLLVLLLATVFPFAIYFFLRWLGWIDLSKTSNNDGLKRKVDKFND